MTSLLEERLGVESFKLIEPTGIVTENIKGETRHSCLRPHAGKGQFRELGS